MAASQSDEESLWNDALALNIAGDSPAALAIFGAMTRNCLPLELNQAILSIRSNDHLAAVEIITEALTNNAADVDPRLLAFGAWIRGIARSESGDEASALSDFQEAEVIFARIISDNSLDLSEPFGISVVLYLYEIKFNLAVCLWRMGLVDDSAQELADARPLAVTREHEEAFDEVLASGFDPPGCFMLPEDVLFSYPMDPTVGYLSPESKYDMDDAASDASSEDLFQASRGSIPPVPAIPEHILAMVRKNTDSQSTKPPNPARSNTVNSLSSREGLSSVAAALLSSSSPLGNGQSFSKEQAERELAEALAAAKAYRDSWASGSSISENVLPPVAERSSEKDSSKPSSITISRRVSSKRLTLNVPPTSYSRDAEGLAMIDEEDSRDDVTEDEEDHLDDISPPSTDVFLPDLSIRSASRSPSPNTDDNSHTSSQSIPQSGQPRLKRSEGRRVPAVTVVSALQKGGLGSIPSPASSNTTTSTAPSNITLLPILDVPIETRGSLPDGTRRRPPPSLPSTKSKRDHQSSSWTTPASSTSSNTSTSQNTSPTSATSASGPSSSSTTLTSMSNPKSNFQPNSPNSQSDVPNVQVLSPLPRASLAGPILKTMGVTYHKGGSLPGGVKRTPPTLTRNQMLSPTATAAGSENSVLDSTAPATTTTTKKRSESSAPAPASDQIISPVGPQQGLRPRATTINSFGGQVPPAHMTPPPAQSQLFMELLHKHQAEQQRLLAEAQILSQQNQLLGPRSKSSGSGADRSLKASASASVLPSQLGNQFDGPGLKLSASVSALSALGIGVGGPAPAGPPQFPSVAAVGSTGFHRPRAVTLDSKPNMSAPPTGPLPKTPPMEPAPLPETQNSTSPALPHSVNRAAGETGGSPTLRRRAATLETSNQRSPSSSPQVFPKSSVKSPISPASESRRQILNQVNSPLSPSTSAKMKMSSPLSPNSEKNTPPITPTTPGSGVSITIRSSSLGGNLPAPHPKWLAKQSPNKTAPMSPPPTGQLPPTPTSPLSPRKERKEKKLKEAGAVQQGLGIRLSSKPLPPTPMSDDDKEHASDMDRERQFRDSEGGKFGGKDPEVWKRETITDLLGILDNLGEGGQTQFLAYADYLVALDEVLEKDLKGLMDAKKHKSFFTVCSDDDDDESEAVMNALSASRSVSNDTLSQSPDRYPREEEVRFSRRLTARSDNEAPWASIIDMILAKRFSIPSEPSTSRQLGDRSSSSDEEEDADEAVAREFLKAFRKMEDGHRDSNASSLEFSDSGESPSAISIVAGKKGEKLKNPNSPLRVVSLAGNGESEMHGEATITASLLGALVQGYSDPKPLARTSSLNRRPSAKRRVPVMSYVDSDTGDTDSTFSVEASLAYKARDLDSFYDDEVAAAGPDYRDSFSSFAASGFLWRYGDDLMRRSTTREKKNSPDGGERDWKTTETSRLPDGHVDSRRDVRQPAMQATTPASAPAGISHLAWMGPESSNVPNGGPVFGSPTNSGSLGRHLGKAKENGITRRIADFMMRHLEKYTENHQHQQQQQPQQQPQPQQQQLQSHPYPSSSVDAATDPKGLPQEQGSSASLLLLQALSVPDIESFLYVRFDFWGAYKRRWCILRDRNLYIVRSPTDLRLIAVLGIGRNTVILPDVDASKHLGPLQQRYGFKVFTRGPGEDSDDFPARKDSAESFASSGYEVPGSVTSPDGGLSGAADENSSSSAGSSPVIHFATEHQLTVINWVGHLARSARGDRRAKPVPLIPVKNSGVEPGRAPLIPGDHPMMLSGLLAKAGAHLGLLGGKGSSAVARSDAPSLPDVAAAMGLTVEGSGSGNKQQNNFGSPVNGSILGNGSSSSGSFSGVGSPLSASLAFVPYSERG
ncbi:hypothetical protein HDU97_004783 [Phlyctochytrium planicorne]|nr:hypothetical protein HDU97_004783 [Phlyctochytrium planicorne]